MCKATDVVPTLVDQGEADEFLEEQLSLEILEAAARFNGYSLAIN